ncbi:hypothetical protein VNO78_05908 [Psophocarpus tetragonolobus]|uniref:Uncharacterized protein n=1 Tax=Psophocarpus tetragonolobus TaxID=3891 RepID=A0AAN9SUC0_PSOTE
MLKSSIRKLSLMVHPRDKCKHPQAKDASAGVKEEEAAEGRKLQLLVEAGKYEQQYEQSEEFKQELKIKISEEESRLERDEEEQKETWKRKRDHEEEWEGTRDQRVSFL